MKSDKTFSICKGIFSIKFNCQNEHNFFLTADQISKLDLDHIKNKYKESRLRLEEIHEAQKKGEHTSSHRCSSSSSSSCCKPLVNVNVEDDCYWCPRCIEYFDHCVDTHNHDVLELVGGLFTKQIMYKCRSKGHVFYVSSLRKHKF